MYVVVKKLFFGVVFLWYLVIVVRYVKECIVIVLLFRSFILIIVIDCYFVCFCVVFVYIDVYLEDMFDVDGLVEVVVFLSYYFYC